MTARRIIIGKAGGTAGANSVNYKISIPAEMIHAIGVTSEDRDVDIELVGKKIVITKKKKSDADRKDK